MHSESHDAFSSQTVADSPEFLRGGSEMGRLIAAVDWSATGLGPIATWPQTLRTTLSLCLATKFPTCLTWGPHNLTFYNDSYLPICGAKHPVSLGRDYREIWADAWPWLGEPYARALAGEPAFLENQRLFLDRHGFLEETFFTLSFSPVRDASGKVCGVFNPAAETTSASLNERRTSALRDLTERTTAAKSTDEVFAVAAEVLAAYDLDLPFVLFYMVEDDAGAPRLVDRTGPAVREDASRSWPLAEVVRSRQATTIDLGDVFAAPCGPYPECPRLAVALPIAAPGVDQPIAVLVAGVSARLELNDAYRAFYDLLAGAITGAVANARAHEEVRRRAEVLAVDRAKTAFFSNVSHELRTPLTLMLGPTEDALASAERNLGGPELETVHRNGVRLLKLVNTLLDFARIEAGRADASYEATDLGMLTTDLASTFRSAMDRAGLELEVDCAALREPVYVDREMWEKIVLNLLSNAFKFTFEGRVRVALREIGDHVELEVTDTGVGIPDDALPRVFERFHRVEGTRSRTHEGTGIGLALVHELVRLHGGSTRVTSAVGRGTSFFVELPLGTAHLPKTKVSTRATSTGDALREAYVGEALRWLPDAPAREPRAVTPSARVLVADDNSDMRDYLARLLAKDFVVEAVPDGAQALELAKSCPPDLVLTDVMMPNLDGFGLVRELRADPRTSAVPVVILSARAGEESRIEGFQAGVDDFLVKPFSARELVARVESHVKLAHSARERAVLVEREANARREAELQKEHVASLLMQAPTPICIMRGPEYLIELANPDMCKLWGRSCEQLVGRQLFDALPELRGQVFEGFLRDVMTTGVPHTGREAIATMARGPEGALEDVYLNYAYTPLRNLRGEVDGVLVIASEVTDAVRARDQMSKLRDAAEGSSRAKDEFLAMLSHELRNPLAPLRTSLEIIRKRLPSLVDRQLDVIERQAKNLTRIVDDLLEVSRVTQGKIELQQSRVDLGTAVSLAVDSTRELVDARHHDLSISLPIRPVFVMADPVRLDQIVVNLVNNAAKYTDVGGHIWVSLAAKDGFAELRVRDDGAGIPAELLPRVFELFEQGTRDLSRTQGGLGIGLSIVRRLVELHGGSVEARSEGPGRGTELVVRLPLAAAVPQQLPPELPPETDEARPDANGEKPAGSGRLRILVVDDNLDAAEMLAALIEELGHEARTALDGPAALRMTEEWPPDLVFLDIGLPGMDGYEVARQLKRREHAHALLVALTGYGQESDRRKSFEAGFDQHIVKPPQFATIEAIIERTGRDVLGTIH
jgi:signal transduction histidine kinase/DNA-binding response OmpR family regulator